MGGREWGLGVSKSARFKSKWRSFIVFGLLCVTSDIEAGTR